MKKSKQIISFLSGMMTALLLIGMATPALATGLSKYIEVFTGVSIYVDDAKLDPRDANGNPVDVFIYNGTTYLPVRAVSEALETPVQWDGSTRSVYIGKHSGDKPAAYLSQIDYFYRDYWGITWSFDKISKDNLGNEHFHSIEIDSFYNDGEIKYKLNGQYSRLTTTYFQQYSYRDSTDGGYLIIWGDGIELWRGSVGGGIDPIDIDINLTGVLELKLEIKRNGHNVRTALGEVALWT